MYSTRVSRRVRAPREAVYRALLDAGAIARWRVPTGMTSHVHRFDAHEGGSFRISLSYDAPSGTGKSAPRTDTYHGHFARLVPDEQVVEVIEFETDDPDLRGQMTMTTTLTDAAGGTEVLIVHEGIPDKVPAADNETGTRMALDNLARLVESQAPARPVTLCVLLWARPGAESGLIAYEDEVLAIAAGYGGRVRQRARSGGAAGQPLEIQLLEFPSARALEEFMTDGRRQSLAGQRDRVIAKTEVIDVQLVPPDPAP